MSEVVARIDAFLSEEGSRKEKRNRKIKKTGDISDEKDGGRRKRRTAYTSGRQEVSHGKKRKKRVDLRTDLKKALGIRQKTKSSSLSGTGHQSKHRWKKY